MRTVRLGGSAPMISSSLNTFDAVVLCIGTVAAVMGFMTGLLRSLVAILAYVAAAPFAMLVTPPVAAFLSQQSTPPQAQAAFIFFALFVVFGIVVGAAMRVALNELVGPQIGFPDRLAGALLGVIRIGLVAIVVVLVFDRLIPPHLEPDFLKNSRLRPILSRAGAMGLKTLPPEVDTYIDRLKRDHGL